MIYRIIRLTTPNLNYFIVCGALILYVSVYIRMARTNNATFWKVNCHVSGDKAYAYDFFHYVLPIDDDLDSVFRVLSMF